MPSAPLPPSPATPPSPPGRKDPTVILEDVLIVLSIPVLWLFVLKLRGFVYSLIGGVTLVVLLVILYRRIRRIDAAAEKGRPKDDGRKHPL